MNEHFQNILALIHQAAHLNDEERAALIKEINSIDKAFSNTAFKLERAEKVKHTTAVLLDETIEELEQKRKAIEAKNKELDIEAALERVRARTMAMHESAELAETAVLLFEQLRSLGLNLRGCGFNIWEKDEKICTAWMNTPDGKVSASFRLPLTEEPLFRRFYESRQNGEDFWVHETGEKELAARYEYLATLPELNRFFEKDRRENAEIPKLIVDHVVNFSHGNLIFITYEHCPESWDIFKRFGKVFEQTYTRFLDLQKAEAQAREAQIEAALERVRSRSMGMQKSEELREVIQVIYEQMVGLNIHIDGAGFDLDFRESDDWNLWHADAYTPFPNKLHIPYFDHRVANGVIEAKNKGVELLTFNLTVEERKKLFDHVFKYAPASPEAKEMLYNTPGLAESHVYLKNVFLYVQNYAGIPFTDAENEIFIRFGKVFEQTYARFKDLEKAEAQTREAQIEASLERVRSRTMAMHRSEELAEVAMVLFEQMSLLDNTPERFNIRIVNEKDKAFEFWATDQEGKLVNKFFKAEFDKSPVVMEMYNAWKSNENMLIQDLHGKRLSKWVHYIKDVLGVPFNTELLKEHRFLTSIFFTHGMIGITTSDHPGQDTINLIKRFAKVFEQTYTRFLDLQKAEVQARESQIQLSLERVRARTMAMHKSEELIEVIASVFQQLEQLNFKISSANLFLNYKEQPFKFWTAIAGNPYPAELDVPYGDFAVMNRFMQEKDSDVKLLTVKFNQEEKNEWVRHLMQHTIVGQAPDEKKRQMLEAPGLAMSVVGVKNMALAVTNYSLQSFSDEENEILSRILIVFDQTYTRFLDLQKAEAQAKEAQIVAALERVRSRTTGMQKSEELRDIIQLVFEQLRALDFNIDSAHFNLNYKESDDYTLWSAAPGQPYPVETHIPYFDHPVFTKAREAKAKGLDFFTESYSQEEKNKFFEHLFKHVPAIPAERRKYILSGPGVAASTVLMNTISLWVMNYAAIPYSDAENAILKRFGNIFEQSHTRFLDLKKAEEQALETIKRASVDRVRAEIASMRTTYDLERITPLIWNELTTLGVPFIRCGVFIMDEESQQMETHLSTPGGEAIATFNLPYNSPGETPAIVAHWHRKELYKQHWNEAQFVEFTQTLVQRGAIANGEKYLAENRPADLYLHFLPFLQGMLYAGNTSPLSDDELQLMQNLADAFSTAYARYQDFNKLEAAKKQVDSTLTELQATQRQLIQSEKMASLGELTAGIAHEIQNPLNFVNNFSEVNKELLAELNAEIEKGNYQEVKMIAADIAGNEEKISHHGKRADAIVKGMMQHSRSTSTIKEPTDINALADEYLRLAYHGLRAKDKSFNATMKTDLDATIGKINIIPQDIGRVILNVINNAFYTVNEKKKLRGDGFEPTVSLTTRKVGEMIEIKVADNGNGIPHKAVDKIFQPFFTTKPTGQGTGLGLSLGYDIVKAHGGEIKVETKEGEGSRFIIQLPFN